MKTVSRLLLAFLMLVGSTASAIGESVQVTLSGLITSNAQLPGAYSSPVLAVGNPFSWTFSYNSGGETFTDGQGFSGITSSTLTIGSDTWVIGSTGYGMEDSVSGAFAFSLLDPSGPSIPTNDVEIGDYGAAEFTWTLSAPIVETAPTAEQLSALVSFSPPSQVDLIFSGHALQIEAISDAVTVSINGAVVSVPPTPPFTLAPATLSFGMTAIGTNSASQSVIVTNTSSAPIAIGPISASANFSQTNNCNATLGPGAQCTVAANFAPTMGGGLLGALTIPYAGFNYGVTVSGVAPLSVTLAASSQTATVGKPVTLTYSASPGSTCTASSSSTTSMWSGTVSANGSSVVNETVAGTDTYTIHCTATGTSEVDQSATVTWLWPPVTATLTALPTTITAGQSTVLTWSSTNATTCVGTGGGANDSWTGTKAANGSQTVTEPDSLAVASLSLNFGITCTSAQSGLSGKASASVVENQAVSATKSGGGGSLSWDFLLGLLGVLSVRLQRMEH